MNNLSAGVLYDLSLPSPLPTLTDQEFQSDEDLSLKRKVGEEGLDDEPDHKIQHTAQDNQKKDEDARHKSSANPSSDEARRLKRKEQNRAAQRAFRERKEKRVRDLEDTVAALNVTNATALQENENLREAVSRLQTENMRLRQSQFTFSVPTQSSAETIDSSNQPQDPGASTDGSMHDSSESQLSNMHRQNTATADAISTDLCFQSVLTHTPYTTIKSNPMLMPFHEADGSDPIATQQQQRPNGSSIEGEGSQQHEKFDFSQQLFSEWPDLSMSHLSSMEAFELTQSLDELSGTSYDNNGAVMDFSFGAHPPSPSSSLSPVSHQNTKRNAGSSHGHSAPTSSSPSGSSSDGSSGVGTNESTFGKPKGKYTRENIARAIAQDQGSMFVIAAAKPE